MPDPGLFSGLLLVVGGGVAAGIALVLRRRDRADTAALEAAQRTAAALERALQRDRIILDYSSDGIVGLDSEGRVTVVNRTACALLGFSETELMGQPLHPLIHHTHEDGTPAAGELCPVFSTVTGARTEVSDRDLFWRKDGGSLPVEYSSIALIEAGRPAGAVLTFRHIAALREHEAHLAALNRTHAVLSACNRALVRATDESGLLAENCRLIVELGGYRFAWVGFIGDDGRIEPQASAGFEEGYLSAVPHPDGAAGWDGPVCRALGNGVPVVVSDLDGEEGGAWREEACRRGYRAVIALPLWADGAVFGVLSIFAPSAHVFDQAEVELLTELADDLAFGIHTLRTREAHRSAETLLQIRNRVIEATRNGVMICDALADDFPLVYVNPAFEAITGYAAGQVLGRNPRFLSGKDRGQPELEVIRAALREKRPATQVLRNFRQDGSLFWNELHITPIREASGRVTHFVGILQDVTERKDYEAQLEFRAQYDELTGLPNRNLLQDRLMQALSNARRQGQPVAVLFVDIDNFKLVNEGLGHRAGDEVLTTVAARLKSCAREGDTVAHPGSDEFVVLLLNPGSPEDVASAARRMLEQVREPLATSGQQLSLSASVGASLFPGDGDDAETLLRNAHAATYHAKSNGRGGFEFYRESFNVRAVERLLFEQQLRLAVERDELELHYQPQVDLHTGRVVAMEALLRWNHPELGMIAPNRFIPLAEDTGLIIPIGEWVLRTACAQNRRWQEAGLPKVVMAVNVSVSQLHGQDLRGLVERVLAETALPARYLELELTESMLMGDPAAMHRKLGQLKSTGISISLDDFGTGYSSLNYLKRFPFDKLKVDKSFVDHVTTDPDDATITRTIITMAHSLKLRVIAEGVESEPQLNYLRRCGCDEIQGYFFSRPLPAEAAGALIARNPSLCVPAETTGAQPTLLLVDDEPNITRAVERLLRRDGYRILIANSPLEAFDLLANHDVQVVISDQRMPEMTGAELLKRVRELHPQVIRILLTGYTELSTITEAVNQGWLFKLLTKPWDDAELRESVRAAFLAYGQEAHTPPAEACPPPAQSGVG